MMRAMAAVLVAAAAAPAMAATPIAAIERFYAVTQEVMKAGKTLGFEGRAHRFEGAVREAFDLPEMTRFAVGPAWAGYSNADKAALADAFGRLTAASYAQNFTAFAGEKFVIQPATVPRGNDLVVRSQIVGGDGKAAQVDYRMRTSAAGWKAVDVYYQGGISQLSIRRSEFAATVAGGGAPALIRKLEAMAAAMKKEAPARPRRAPAAPA